MPRPSFEWTDERIRIMRRLWPTTASRAEIANAIGCAESTVRDKARSIGLSTGRVRERCSQSQQNRADPARFDSAGLVAERERLLATDTRDVGARIMGEPHPERSALAQRDKPEPVKIRPASAGMLTTIDETRRAAQWASQFTARGGFKNGGGRTTALRLKRDQSNGGGAHKAIVSRQARREREARA